jgi:Domain of unknown function (DUF4185)
MTTRSLCRLWFTLLLSLVCSAAEMAVDLPSNPQIIATPWPEADALFHQDSRWLGADDAYSVDLGHDRVLWLFADTFIATTPAHRRRESKMIRNSVAIEHGYDPSRATMKFYWGSDGKNPTSFFAEQDDVWSWPGDGIRVGPILLVFLMRIHGTSTGIGFEGVGWDAVVVANPDEEPSNWKIKRLECPQNNFGVVIGSGGVLQDESFVYAFGSHEPAVHDIYVVRWPLSSILLGDLKTPQWWDGTKSTWVAQRDLPAKPPPVFVNGTTEFTVHHDSRLQAFVEIQSQGFDSAQIAIRSAPALTGPWSLLRNFYRPPEADFPGVFNYAAKAHPELKAEGSDLILTYLTNASKFSRLIEDTSLYYPRMLKLHRDRLP